MTAALTPFVVLHDAADASSALLADVLIGTRACVGGWVGGSCPAAPAAEIPSRLLAALSSRKTRVRRVDALRSLSPTPVAAERARGARRRRASRRAERRAPPEPLRAARAAGRARAAAVVALVRGARGAPACAPPPRRWPRRSPSTAARHREPRAASRRRAAAERSWRRLCRMATAPAADRRAAGQRFNELHATSAALGVDAARNPFSRSRRCSCSTAGSTRRRAAAPTRAACRCGNSIGCSGVGRGRCGVGAGAVAGPRQEASRQPRPHGAEGGDDRGCEAAPPPLGAASGRRRRLRLGLREAAGTPRRLQFAGAVLACRAARTSAASESR